MSKRQADACPYRRPFDDDFSECPAFRRSQFLAVDMQYRPLGTVVTCANLHARSLPRTDSGFYGACAIGDAAARERWAAQIQEERLARIRQLARTLGEATRDAARKMWEAKAEQLRAVREGRSASRETRRMRQAADAYETYARRVLSRYRADLADLGIDFNAVLDLLHEAIREWAVRTDAVENYRPSPEVLARFPADVRAFLNPNAT